MTEQEWYVFNKMPKAAQLDYDNPNDVAQYLRELISFNKVLVNGFDYEYNRLRQILISAGWDKDQLCQLIENGCKATFYEKVLDHSIKECGDRTEYSVNKGRWKK